jgi:uncharacterized protein (TIGR02996 family)
VRSLTRYHRGVELPPELEAAIRAAPDDRAGYVVAADWLTSQGDPQGELIALSFAPPTDDIAARIAELQRQLAPVQAHGDYRPVRLVWRWGFVFAVGAAWPGPGVPQMLRTLLRSPIARFVRELRFVMLHNADLIEALAKESRALASVRELVIAGAADTPIPIEPVWLAMPELERLVLGIANEVGPLALPRLRELSIAGSREASLQASDLAMRLPALRRLTVGGVAEEDWRDIEVAEQLELCDVIVTRAWRGDRRLLVDRVGPRDGQRTALIALAGLEGPPPGTLFELPDVEQFTLGRATEADFRLQYSSVGRRHTRFIRTLGAGWSAMDMGTTNGTRVNGQLIHTGVLRSGDELSVGAVDFRFLAGDVDAQAAELRARFGLSP